MNRFWQYGLAAVVFIAVAVYVIKPKARKIRPSAESVTTLTVSPSKISTVLESIGTAVSNECVDIKSNVTEKVESVHFSDCEYVKQGQVLVQLNIKKKLAEKKQIEAEVQLQEREVKRLSALKSKKVIQTRDYDNQCSALSKAEAQLEKVNAEIEESTISAPFEGFLGMRQISPGALVTSGTIITTLDDVKKLKVDFSVPEKYNSLITPHSKITATSTAVPDQKFTGEISAVVPRVSMTSRSISVRGIINNSNLKLRPGMMLQIMIPLKDKEGIRIPERAISSIGEKHFVFVVNGNKVEQRFVKTGDQTQGIVEIISGLEVGEKIVNDGIIKLSNGSEIVIEKDDTEEFRELLKQKDASE